MPADFPLIALVNSRSGGQQGTKIIEKLKKYIPSEHVFDVAEGGPAPGLLKHKGRRFRLLVCGGDGTVGWVLSEVEKLKLPQDITPPIAILPLGTGNDLSRTLKWGAGFTGKGLSKVLAQVEKACMVLMDKWKVTFEGCGDEPTPTTHFFMNNYFSIGADADVALQFHEMRTAYPARFTSRTQNLAWYLRLGLQNLSPEPIYPHISVEIDGHEVKIPEKTRCVVVLNLPSYAGGGNPWGPYKNSHKKRNFTGPAIDDGLLEVVAINGPVQIAAIHANVGRGKKLGQGRDIKITTRKMIPTQVDGEPWKQPPSVITIQHAGTSMMLANSPPTRPSSALPNLALHNSAPSSPDLSSPGSSNIDFSNLASSSDITPSPPASPAAARVFSPSHMRSRSSSAPMKHTPSPISYGPTHPSKRKKNRLYCDGCGLEFFLPHMLSNHLSSGLCCPSSSSTESSTKKESRKTRTLSLLVTSEAYGLNRALGDSGEAQDWRTRSADDRIESGATEGTAEPKERPESPDTPELTAHVPTQAAGSSSSHSSESPDTPELRAHVSTQAAGSSSSHSSDKPHQQEVQQEEDARQQPAIAVY